jgi:hypothetical protein
MDEQNGDKQLLQPIGIILRACQNSCGVFADGVQDISMADFLRSGSKQSHAIGGKPTAVEAEQHFRKVLDELPAAIYTTDAMGRITYFNEAAAGLWGHRPELGKSEWCGSWKLSNAETLG